MKRAEADLDIHILCEGPNFLYVPKAFLLADVAKNIFLLVKKWLLVMLLKFDGNNGGSGDLVNFFLGFYQLNGLRELLRQNIFG